MNEQVHLSKMYKERLEKRKLKYEAIDDHTVTIFCKRCGESVGKVDLRNQGADHSSYCVKCYREHIKPVPREIDCGTIVKDFGSSVVVEYRNNYYQSIRVFKDCYINSKGNRYIVYKGKRYFV